MTGAGARGRRIKESRVMERATRRWGTATAGVEAGNVNANDLAAGFAGGRGGGATSFPLTWL